MRLSPGWSLTSLPNQECLAQPVLRLGELAQLRQGYTDPMQRLPFAVAITDLLGDHDRLPVAVERLSRLPGLNPHIAKVLQRPALSGPVPHLGTNRQRCLADAQAPRLSRDLLGVHVPDAVTHPPFHSTVAGPPCGAHRRPR